MILLLDNYDSFTYNLRDYLLQTGVSVQVQTCDRVDVQDVAALAPEALVLSPGPGRPAQAGNLMRILSTWHKHLPILGICLGHQAIGELFGAELLCGDEPVHGKTAALVNQGDPLFKGLPGTFPVMRYHSLVLKQIPDCLEVIAAADDGVVMGIRHRQWPLVGLQFHPESIGTPDGLAMLQNWVESVVQRQVPPGNRSKRDSEVFSRR